MAELGDWDAYLAKLDGHDFLRRFDRHVGRAFKRAGLLLVGEMRKAVRAGKYAPNAPLTKAMKGSSKPLVDRGDLMRALTYDVYKLGTAWVLDVGINRQARGKGGMVYNLGRALHEGFTLKVTPAMRAAVFAKLAERQGAKRAAAVRAKIAGLGAHAVWVIPPRPFIMDPVLHNWPQVRGLMQEAYSKALRGED